MGGCAFTPLMTAVVLAACAVPPDGVETPAPAGERRCIGPQGEHHATLCEPGAASCACEAETDIVAFVPACPDGVAPSAAWHDPIDPARRRAARDGSMIGDGDATGPFCLPAPPN